MKKLPILLGFVMLLAAWALTPSCHETEDSTYTAYQEWYEYNYNWLEEQQKRTNEDGTPYFKAVFAPWDPTAYVLIHYFNDTTLTRGNLSPLYTSTIDTRYYLTNAKDEPMDSSYNQSTYGPGIYRTKLSDVITGWAIAYQVMHVGDTVECIIPYQQAYGVSTSSSVAPYTNLKYNMSLVDIYRYEINPN